MGFFSFAAFTTMVIVFAGSHHRDSDCNEQHYYQRYPMQVSRPVSCNELPPVVSSETSVVTTARKICKEGK